MQIGDEATDVRIVVSTVVEMEHVLPLLESLQTVGRRVNVLYGLPLPGSQVDRIADVARRLGAGSISLMVDHASQLGAVRRFRDLVEFPASIFVKVDTGYHRAGLPPSTLNKGGLLDEVARLHLDGALVLAGFYSHSSLSYNDSTPIQAMNNLAAEIRGCMDAVRHNSQRFPAALRELTVSVGASPQVMSIQNFAATAEDKTEYTGASEDLVRALREVAATTTTTSHDETSPGDIRVSLELHAGVYSVMDLQQLATNATGLASSGGAFYEQIAVSVAAEVVSTYNDGERETPEALIAVGTLGLGREPCQSYDGWGIVGPTPATAPRGGGMLVVKRISQEHSILCWGTSSGGSEGGSQGIPPIPLEVGNYVRIYPNHACITGAMYGWYLVVDSDRPGGATEIIDVWMRASGW